VTSSSPATDALWLDTLHRICGRAAHELKGALNGVSINLEVVRSRAEQPGASASAVGTFAMAAAHQLDDVIAMTEALLALGRPAREPVEIALAVRRVEALLAPAARADGRRLELDGSVRLAVGASLLAAVDAAPYVRCSVVDDASVPTICIDGADGSTFEVDAAIVDAAAEAGIRIQAGPTTISISFPR